MKKIKVPDFFNYFDQRLDSETSYLAQYESLLSEKCGLEMVGLYRIERLDKKQRHVAKYSKFYNKMPGKMSDSLRELLEETLENT